MDPLIQGAIIAAIAMVFFMIGMPIAFALGLTSILSILQPPRQVATVLRLLGVGGHGRT